MKREGESEEEDEGNKTSTKDGNGRIHTQDVKAWVENKSLAVV